MVFAGCVAASVGVLPVTAQDRPTYNLSGVTGLIEMPSAEMQPDGTLSFGVSELAEGRRFAGTFQILPWVEGTLRYSGIGDVGGSTATSGFSLWDRSLDLRFRVLSEGRIRPAVVLGLQDVLGTGVFSAEYLVATKHLGNDLAVTAGLGWGRLATGNQIASFGTRDTTPTAGGEQGGALRLEQAFRGDIGVFGGVEWRTPVQGLSLVAEYSSDDNSAESRFGVETAESPWNFGIEYQISDFAEVGLYSVYGTGIGLRFTALTNPKGPDIIRKRPDDWTPPLSYGAPSDPEVARMTKAFDGSGLRLTGFVRDRGVCHVGVENKTYRKGQDTVARAREVLLASPAADCEKVNVQVSVEGLQTASIPLTRAGDGYAIGQATEAQRLSFGAGAADFKQFSLSFGPDVRFSLFDPDNPLYYDISLELRAAYQFTPRLSVSGQVSRSLLSTFDDITRGVKGSLPKVRTNAALYSNELGPRLDFLTVDYFHQFRPDLFGHVSLGYLESMYAGVSGEVYWRPENSRLAFSAEVNFVEARDFDQRFGLRDLPGLSRLNGHVSAYWQTGFNGIELQFDAGRYLAGDNGVTLTISRNFGNGWEIGAFATLTSASSEDFGEGSFDKGFIFKIPLGVVTRKETRNRNIDVLRSLTGDGGQRLTIRNRLHEMLKLDKPESFAELS